jgi:hypothetical protein
LERRPEEVGKRLKQRGLEVVARAQSERAVIFRGDETAVKEEANQVRGDAPRGQTPVLAMPMRWRKLSKISAVSPRGEEVFRIVEGSMDAERFIEFLTALIAQAIRKISWL